MAPVTDSPRTVNGIRTLREIKQEFGLIAALALAAFVGTRVVENDILVLAVAAAVYLCWHMVNMIQLLRWIGRPRFKTPVSYGIWEWIFDKLQAIKLRNRKRKRDLFRILRQYRLVIGGIADAVVLLDDRGQVRWFNAAATRLLGISWPEASKAPISRFLDHPLLTDQLKASFDFRPIEIPSPINGAIILRIEISELEGVDQRLLIARDITKTHNLELSRKDFVANVSHELRTPLTVFRGYLEMLSEELRGLPDLAEPVGQLEQQAGRMQDLVEDLLDLSRFEFSDGTPAGTLVPVPDLVALIVEDAQHVDEAKRNEFIVDVDSQIWLKGDADILRTAFSNLIVNAVKHTQPGTSIFVEWYLEDGGAVFRVRDNGQGIAAYHLPRLTERFYRVHSGRSRGNGGTGLGLAIVKHALERHGATLRIESTPGEGSSFTCHFSASRTERARDPRSTLPGRGRRSGLAAHRPKRRGAEETA